MGADVKRPLIVAGYGIRLHQMQNKVDGHDRLEDDFPRFARWFGVPVVTTWTGADLLPTDDPLNIGILGMCGQAGANKAVHECDYLLALGTGLGMPLTTTLTDKFAPNAKINVINPDQDRLDHLTVRADFKACATFAEWMHEVEEPFKVQREWLDRCAQLKKMNEIGNPRASSGVNSYWFNNTMNRMLPPGTCMVIDGGGTALYTGFQSAYVKEGSRLVCSSSMSAMGSGIPEAIGACFANGKKLTTCIVGDGSFLLNIQELQTVKHHKLPIKIFVINNKGYLSVRHTQDAFLDGHRFGTGCSDTADISWPRIEAQARAYDIPYMRISSARGIEAMIGAVIHIPGPVICEVMCPEDQEMRWKQKFTKDGDRFIPHTLEDMAESV